MRLWKYLKNKMHNNLNQKICEKDAEMSFEELIVFAETFAKKLKGIRCCAIMCQSELAAGIALLSCFAADVTALPLSYRYGEKHCNKILDTISPDAIILDKDSTFQVIRINHAKYVIPQEKPMLIMCTSGTTGIPKGVMLTEDNIIANVSDISLYFDIGTTDSILISRPLYHCAALTGEFLTALVKGSRIHFYSGSFNPAAMLRILQEKQITVICGTPTLLAMMARFKRKDDQDCLRRICISGECMGANTGKRIAEVFPNAKIYHIYGLTEACPRVSYLPPDLYQEYTDFVGIPLKSVAVKIIAPNGLEAGINEVGILWVKGKNIMAGYYNDPIKTSEVIKDGWLCTGDLAMINEAGLLKIKGRNDDLIIKAGMNIYPQEIENALRQDVRVRNVRVYDKHDSKRGTQIAMDIAGDFTSVSERKELCQSCLPVYQMPTIINLLAEIPQTASGKIKRRGLQ